MFSQIRFDAHNRHLQLVWTSEPASIWKHLCRYAGGETLLESWQADLLTGYGWTTVSMMDSLQLLKGADNKSQSQCNNQKATVTVNNAMDELAEEAGLLGGVNNAWVHEFKRRGNFLISLLRYAFSEPHMTSSHRFFIQHNG